MTFLSLLLWDMRLQAKHGFYLLYGILTALYLLVLFALPEALRESAAAILIFSDPAAMGLYFMGAIVLLEKSQRIPCAMAVSPVGAGAYVLSKTVSLGVVSLLVAAVLAGFTAPNHVFAALAGTALSGTMFTLLGIAVATKITSLNQFLLWTIPVEALGFAPAVLHLLGLSPAVLRFYPPNVCMDLISGRAAAPLGLLCTALTLAALFALARCRLVQMWRQTGGVRL